MTTEIQALLDHAQWVRSLARQLVPDPNVAEDLAQDAMVAALGNPANRPSRPRAWLSSVVRTLAWERYREESRRERREHRAARTEATASTSELVERMSVHRQVVETLMALPDLYRDVLLRRYFDGQTPSEIANEQTVPIATVKTRLQRGLALMRGQLDQAHGGDGQAWIAALAPLTRLETKPVVSATGRVALITAVFTLLGLGFGLHLLESNPAIESQPRASAVSLDIEKAEETAPIHIERTEEHAENSRDLAGPSSNEPAPQLTPRRRVRGRVYDSDGRPKAGVLVSCQEILRNKSGQNTRGPGMALALSSANGSFELKSVRPYGVVQTIRKDLTTLFEGIVPAPGQGDMTVVVSPAKALTGTIKRQDGRAIEGASVIVLLPDGIASSLGGSLKHARPHQPWTTTNDAGHFSLERVAAIPGIRVRVEREGFETALAMLGAEQREVDVILRKAGTHGRLRGSVAYPDGTPAIDVRVSNGYEVTRTTSNGSFALPMPKAGADVEITAMTSDSSHHAYRLVAKDADGAIDMVLQSGKRTIRGRVEDSDGQAMAGVQVWIGNPTVFRRTRPDDKSVDYETRLRGQDDHPATPVVHSAESLLAGSTGRPGPIVTTGPGGEFELKAMFDRAYEIAAMDPWFLGRATAPVPNDEEEVVLTIGAPAHWSIVKGRVLTPYGDPIAGVNLMVMRETILIREDDVNLYRQTSLRQGGKTDADGRFTLRDVPREQVALRLEGNVIPTRTIPISELRESIEPSPGRVEPIEIRIARRVDIQVALLRPDEADAFSVRDANGKTLPIQFFQGEVRRTTRTQALRNGRSEVVSVEEKAIQLVLFKNGKEVRKQPISLAPGDVRTLRF